MSDLATLGIKVDATGAITQTQTLGASLDSLAHKGTTAAESLKGAFLGITGVAAAGFLGREFLKNTVEAQNAMAQLEAAVKSTGSVAQRSVAQLDGYSMALQQTTTYSDEAVKGAQAMLLTFDKIQGVQFDRATNAIADLAARMGGDLQGAAIQVGKALQDPATGLTALRRSGVSFSESQIAVIKNLYDTGRAAEGQTVILKELEHQFGGSAAAARATLGGALQGLRNDFGDLFEGTKDETSALVAFINQTGVAVKSVRDYTAEIKLLAAALGTVGTAYVAVKAGGVAIAAGATAIAAIAPHVQGVAAAFAVAAANGAGLGGVVAGLSYTVTGALAVFAPLALAIVGVASAMVIINDAAAAYAEKQDDAIKNTKEYVAYLKALGVAHSQAGGAGKLAAKATEDETVAIAKLTLAGQAELEKLTALNAAHGQSDTTLKLLAIEYDRRAERAKNAVDHTAKETAALNKLTDAIAAKRREAVLDDDADDVQKRERRLAVANKQVEIELAIEATHRKQAKAAKEYETALEGVARQTERIRAIFAGHEAEDAAAAAEKAAQQKYSDDIKAIWQESAGRIAADFIRSMSRGFEEVYNLAVKLMRRMEDEFKRLKLEPGGLKYDALKYGAAAIGGGLAGYQVGQQTGNSAAGLFGGAASGALAGSAFGPGGAIVGGLAGAASGLFGASNAQKDAAEQQRLAALALQAQAGAFISASRSGNSVVDSLGANDAAVAGLLKAGGFSPSAGRTAQKKYTGADIEAAADRNAQRIADDFWKGITQSLNALNGPLGEYQNSLIAIEAQYRQNIEAAKALHATDAQLADIEKVRVGQEKELAAARKRALDEQLTGYGVRLLQAQGQSWAAQQMQMAAAQKSEMDALIKSMGDSIDPLMVAALAAAQAAETAASAWQHTQDVINQGTDWISQQSRVLGTSAADTFAQETQNFGFGGMTPEQVRALYTIWNLGKELTPDQKALNDHIDRWLTDYNSLHPVDQLIAGTTAPSTNYGATSATTAVQSSVTERTAYALVDINRSQLTVLHSIDSRLEQMSHGGGGSSLYDINAGLAHAQVSAGLYGGSVAR